MPQTQAVPKEESKACSAFPNHRFEGGSCEYDLNFCGKYYSASMLALGIVNSNVAFAAMRLLCYMEHCERDDSLYKMNISFLINPPGNISASTFCWLESQSMIRVVKDCLLALVKVRGSCSYFVVVSS